MSIRKIAASIFIFIFIFSNSVIFAQMPVAVPGLAPSLGEFSKIGVVAAIQGKVEVLTPGAAGRVVQSGEEIFIGDEVKTDALGHLQILLLDETVFTIGPNSAIVLDKFIYDPKTHVGNVEASITKGVFRYVSGKIAANKPENVKIKLPTATIGIRGTIVAGEVSSTGSMAMLLGPGTRNETGATIGSFVMNGTGENSGRREHVNRTGFGVSADQTGGLSGVFLVPESQLANLTASLSSSQGQGARGVAPGNDQNAPQGGGAPPQGSGTRPMAGPMPGAPLPGSGPVPIAPGTAPMPVSHLFGAGENVSQVSGEQTYAGFQTTRQVNLAGIMQNGLMQDSTLASQDALHNASVQVVSTTVRNTLKGDMFARVAPVVTYQHFGGLFNFNGFQGTLDAVIRSDFANDKLLGSTSTITINVPGASLADSCVLTDKLFSVLPSIDSPALFQWTNVVGSSGTFTNIEVQFQDKVNQMADGTTRVDMAAQTKVSVDYSQSTLTGAGVVIAPQVPAS